MHQRKYLIYWSEEDNYDLYYLQEAIQELSNHFIISFTRLAEVIDFISDIRDGIYPCLVIFNGNNQDGLLTEAIGQLRKKIATTVSIVLLLPAPAAYHLQPGIHAFAVPSTLPDWKQLATRMVEYCNSQ